MGEEDASATPFQFFTDHHGELADAVREGRRREFASFAAFSDPARRARSPIRMRPRRSNARGRSADTERGPQAARALSPAARTAARASRAASRRRQGDRRRGDRPVRRAGALAARRWRGLTLASNLGAEPCALARPAGDLIFETADGAAALANGQLAGTRRSPSWSRPVDDAVRELAREAGIANDWIDAAGAAAAASRSARCAASWRRSAFRARSKADIAESRARLRAVAERRADIRDRDGRRAGPLDRASADGGAAASCCSRTASEAVTVRAVARRGVMPPARRPAIIACASPNARSRSRSRRRAA